MTSRENPEPSPAAAPGPAGTEGVRVNTRVLVVSAAVVVAFSAWAIIVPARAERTLRRIVQWIAEDIGWVYVVTATAVIVFVLGVALSRRGAIRLGPDDARPEYSRFTWVAMLFAAGVGVDLLFFSVSAPITHYIHPPIGQGRTAEAAREAVVWTMFHYGVTGWAMYALLGMALGCFAYRWGRPLSLRGVLSPLLGRRVEGRAGDAIDIVVLVGTVFGVATSMGIGVVLLDIGLSLVLGLQEGLATQIGLVVVAVVMTILACMSGISRAIRWISEVNIGIAALLVAYVVVTGRTSLLLNALVDDLGRFLVTLPARSVDTMGGSPEGTAWMASWTLFFWAFWLAWAPFVGVFLARVSRGRTLREFVLVALTAPVLCDLVVVSVFGHSALAEVTAGDEEFATLAIASPERGWYALLEKFPGAALLIGLATLSGLMFHLTTANSGAMAMSTFSSTIADPGEDGPIRLRIFWAVLTALVTMAMLIAGGVTTMEHATLIFALPVTAIALLVMASFARALLRDGAGLVPFPEQDRERARGPKR